MGPDVSRARSGRGDAGAGGPEHRDPPRRLLALGSLVPTITGLALLAPLGKDVRIDPVLAWILVALNLAVILGALVAFLAPRLRARPPAPASQPMTRAPNVPAQNVRRVPPPVRTAPAGPVPNRTAPAAPVSPSGDGGLLARLTDPDPFQRANAISALRGRADSEHLLVRALHDRYPMVRREVVRALRESGTPFATETLIKVAAHDPSAEVREEAVAALGSMLRERDRGESRGPI
jgi:hypothetical protein